MKGTKISGKDAMIRELLQDPDFEVTRAGDIYTRRPAMVRTETGWERTKGWRRAGWITPSRFATKLYVRIEYRQVQLYAHRVVYAAFGRLQCSKVVNHIDMDGLNNAFENLELVSPSTNWKHAYQLIKSSGLTAAELRARSLEAYITRED